MAILSISSKYKTGAVEIARDLEQALGYRFIRLGGRGGLLHMTHQVARQMAIPGAKEGEAPTLQAGENAFISFMSLVQSCIFEQAANDRVIILSRPAITSSRGSPMRSPFASRPRWPTGSSTSWPRRGSAKKRRGSW